MLRTLKQNLIISIVFGAFIGALLFFFAEEGHGFIAMNQTMFILPGGIQALAFVDKVIPVGKGIPKLLALLLPSFFNALSVFIVLFFFLCAVRSLLCLIKKVVSVFRE